jgi:thiol-disulfide isomerase/thioredoxin
MFQRSLFTLLSLTCCSTAFADTFVVKVKVVDANKEPVANADGAMFWDFLNGAMTPRGENTLVTDADGKAVLRVDDWNEKRPLMVLSADRTLGGIVGVSKADDGKEVTVMLGPTVRMKGELTCKELNTKPKWANTMVAVDGFRAPFTQNVTDLGAFEFVLPAGKYNLNSYGSDVESVKQTITLAPERSAYNDLGTIDMKANPIAKFRGKIAPNWLIADARGVKADVKLSDYKGKWVYIEFWGHWCGPCVSGALPELIALYEDHADQRDKFEIIAVHERGVKSFAELDPKLTEIKKRYWQGKDLPFPVLLDATGETAKLYGISHYPTGLLINPEGKLVGEVTAADLEAKLPPVSLATKWARLRDIKNNGFRSFEPSHSTLSELADSLKHSTSVEVELDAKAIKACGLTPDGPFPGVAIGYSLTLRSIEELLLAPHGLGIEPSADGKKLLITKRSAKKEAESYSQKLAAKELSEWLDGGSTAGGTEAKPLEIKDQSLLAAVKLVNREFDLPIALDAKAMHDKTLDPQAKVSGNIRPHDLRKSLTKMLEPLGLTVVVRDEVVLVTPKGK